MEGSQVEQSHPRVAPAQRFTSFTPSSSSLGIFVQLDTIIVNRDKGRWPVRPAARIVICHGARY